jgi:RNA ligase (TIGR02306 family)
VSSAICPVYTDIENVRRWSKVLVEGEEVVMTEKIHGANARFVFANGRLYVGSRTRFIKPNSEGLWPGVARAHNLASVLANCPHIAIYGEAYGQVQDLMYGRSDAGLAVFDAMDTRTGKYLDWKEIESLVNTLNMLCHEDVIDSKMVSLVMAPVIYRGPWLGYAAHKALAEGPSILGENAHVREGVVIRPIVERIAERLGRVILKMVGEGYLTR